MLKKPVQQGRRTHHEQGDTCCSQRATVPCYVAARDATEKAAGGSFQHPGGV
jgi:hypothetical protein